MLDNNNEKTNVEQQELKVEKQVNNQTEKEEREKGKGAFYGILAFAIFIIMVVGGTFAYFVASTSSDAGSVQTGSSKVDIDFISYTSAWMKDDLIPVSTRIAEYSVERRPDGQHQICVDDGPEGNDPSKGRSICSLYVFQIDNHAETQNVSIKLKSDNNDFENLKAMIYQLGTDPNTYVAPAFGEEDATKGDPKFATNAEQLLQTGYTEVQNSNGEAIFGYSKGGNLVPIYVNRVGVIKTLLKVDNVPSVAVDVPVTGESVVLANNVNIAGVQGNADSEVSTYMIVLYIYDNGQVQNRTDTGNYAGQVVVDGSSGETRITGNINVSQSENLQSENP